MTPTDEQITERLARFCGRDEWLIRKYGLFYRENYSGYTFSIEEAGRYSGEAAKNHERGCSGEVTTIKAPHPPYLTSIDALRPVLEKLSEEQCEKLLVELADEMANRVNGLPDGRGFVTILTLPPETLARAIAEVIGESE